MNFSDLFQHSNQLCKFSPNGRHVCSCSQCRVVVRDIATLQIVAVFTCLDPVQYIEWASDSVHVMCGMFKRGMVQVRVLQIRINHYNTSLYFRFGQ